MSVRRLAEALRGAPAPLAAVDIEAARSNAATLVDAASGLPIRVASKSIRSTALIRKFLEIPGFHGVLAFTPAEAVHLGDAGVDDVLIAYPSVDRGALATVARHRSVIRPLIDSADHVRLLAEISRETNAPIPVCLDIDAGWRPLGGPVHLGPKRSPVRTPEQAAALTDLVCATPGLRLAAVMAYDGQIAGVGDIVPGNPWYQLAVRGMQASSLRELGERLPRVLDAVTARLRAAGAPPLELVNSGGTGSLARIAGLGFATELAAGSGFFAPALFDHYRSLDLEPAAAFALPVVRKPAPGLATVLGGGYIASGPAGASRVPVPSWPPGLSFEASEGAGEVQTPLRGARALRIGDAVWFRHAKAGELCEHFTELQLVEGGQHAGSVSTYRGEGMMFL
ncbi:amino acid deaminase/aldolase [Mycobacteroides abscessus subsp. abscessus]|uniref:amino acid deaminase/aldolase n=1 Tax=Mycobacteroides abscessus TaxID=36809 RepID=UPI0019D10BBE|nr:amino acid deaminase/aldolase [Mycobacteroides abscessus]MBN7536155.1 amino acid deaminase/aldolase [Mycobacteroides abscessus subsp. abscessus]